LSKIKKFDIAPLEIVIANTWDVDWRWIVFCRWIVFYRTGVIATQFLTKRTRRSLVAIAMQLASSSYVSFAW